MIPIIGYNLIGQLPSRETMRRLVIRIRVDNATPIIQKTREEIFCRLITLNSKAILDSLNFLF